MNKPEFDADVVIVGGGMVGGLLAAALAPLSVALIDSSEAKPFEHGSSPDYDLRVSALSVASRRMLEAVGAWEGIEARRVCPYRDLSVWDGEQGGRTDFHARDAGMPELGYIVENRVVQLSLWDQLQKLPNVSCYCPAKLSGFETDDSGVTVKFDSSSAPQSQSPGHTSDMMQIPSRIRARLLVGADGAASAVRAQAGIRIQSASYEQHALVANVTTALPQQQITWQRFVPSGPQAMLPLCGSKASVVWYNTADEVARLVELENQAFIDELCNAFPEELGGIKSVDSRASFPITKAHATTYTAHRIVLAGDAAHTVHPLAGQGVNIGLLDAAALAETLLNANNANRDIGAQQVLARYERWRRFENNLMIESLDAIHKAFSEQPNWFKQVRSTGLNTVNRLPFLRNRLMQRAMGTEGDLPRLARP